MEVPDPFGHHVGKRLFLRSSVLGESLVSVQRGGRRLIGDLVKYRRLGRSEKKIRQEGLFSHEGRRLFSDSLKKSSQTDRPSRRKMAEATVV